MITLKKSHFNEIVSEARQADPNECCGLIGGTTGQAQSIYPLRNVSANAEVSYEAAPEELFAAQRSMRERGEQLLAIYHSHPRAEEPLPSETDIRLAYYPDATYLIVGLAGTSPVLRAFVISERELRWKQVEYNLVDE
jgi:proteasome lid subunit RPN8/RPN11